MKENFFTSMLGEGGKISHKRFISVLLSLAVTFVLIWATVKYKELITGMYNSALIFISVMSGVATVSQIVALVKGGNAPKENNEENKVN
ncbi:MAG: hypothetical protein ACOVNR_06170 [Chitinophagaceae bacterium]